MMIVFAFSLGFFLGREVTLATSSTHPSNQSLSLKNQRGITPSAPKTQREKVAQYKKNWLKTQKEGSPSHLGHLKKAHQNQAHQNQAHQNQAHQNQAHQNQIGVQKAPSVAKHPPNFPDKDEHSPKRAKEFSPPVDESQNSPKRAKEFSPPVDENQNSPKATKTLLTPPTEKKIEEPPEEPKNSSKMQTKSAEKKPQIYALRIKVHQNQESAMKQSTDLKLRFPSWRFFFKKTGKTYTVYIGPFNLKQSAQRALQKLKNKKGFASTRIEEL